MYGVLKISQLAYSATEEDVKNLFKINSVYPEDVHWVLNANGKKSGVAFVAFKNKDLKKAMTLDGMYFRGHRIDVIASSPAEFNSYFPKASIVQQAKIETNWHYQTRNDYPTDYKYETRKIVMDNGYDNQYYDINGRPSEPSQAYSTRYEEKDQYSSFPYGQDAASYSRPYTQSTTMLEPTPRREPQSRDPPSRDPPSRDPPRRDLPRRDLPRRDTQSRDPPKREPPKKEVSTAPRRQTGSKNDHKQSNGKKHRSRSRSPVSKSKKDDKHSSHKRSDSSILKKDEKEKKNVSEKQYVRIVGMSFKSNENDFKSFMKPLDVGEIYLLKFKSGDNAGKPNGSAIIKLQKEEHHSKALSYDGKNYKGTPIQVIRTAKEDILAAIKDKQNKPKLSADLGTLNDLANSNPQIQRLLGLLNEAVSNATAKGSSRSSSTNSKKSSTSTNRNDKHEKSSNRSYGASYSTSPSMHRTSSSQSRSSTKKEDPVINRVATSANIDVEDIKSGRVVGMRNLPSHISTNTILDFFVGYKRIDESVRIHYLDNNHCSGDAIIAFRTNDEARRAVKNLNKKQVSGRKVELFFL